MWWIETTGYHFAGLIWLIVIAALFVISVVALSTASSAMRSARHTRRMVRDHESDHFTTGGLMTPTSGMAAATATPEESKPVAVVEGEPPATDPSLGDSMRILHERYARGEMTREEYLRARDDMMAPTH
jgi:uncharacterized membrane protein